MNTWLRHHRLALAAAFGHLRSSLGSFIFNVIVVAIALALPFAGLTLLENVRPVSDQLAVQPEISIFMNTDTPRERAIALAAEIRTVVQANGISGALEFVAREKALESLQGQSGLADAVTTLGSNPLPDSYVLKLSGFQNAGDAVHVEAIAAQLKALPGIEFIQIDSAWVKRLAALISVLRLGLWLLAATLGAVVVTVVFNTIRLQVMTQREEIDISRLVGATDSYVYRPFYYSGMLLGLCAGALALLVVAGALTPLNAAVAEFARLYASEFSLRPLNAMLTAALLAASAGLGLLGAVLSVWRQLSRAA
ncbi:MAG: cell division protein FtsX [Janthinobacterium lividum]